MKERKSGGLHPDLKLTADHVNGPTTANPLAGLAGDERCEIMAYAACHKRLHYASNIANITSCAAIVLKPREVTVVSFNHRCETTRWKSAYAASVRLLGRWQR